MIVKNIVITTNEKTKTANIKIADSNMNSNESENKYSYMIDILLESFKDDKINGLLKKLV